MLSVLPRRHADDVSGELFVAAYERQLGHYPAEQVMFICDAATARCKWFPTPAECHEIAAEWRRNDDAMRRVSQARAILWKHRNSGQSEAQPWTPEPGELEAIKRKVAESLRVND